MEAQKKAQEAAASLDVADKVSRNALKERVVFETLSIGSGETYKL